MTRILVIDDDSTIRQVVGLVLSDEGYDVAEASNGLSALRSIDQDPPDLILLDMKMPGMDGWEFSKRYRSEFDHPAPIIVFTAATDTAERGLAAGAQLALSKPFDLDELLTGVSTVLAASQRAAQ